MIIAPVVTQDAITTTLRLMTINRTELPALRHACVRACLHVCVGRCAHFVDGSGGVYVYTYTVHIHSCAHAHTFVSMCARVCVPTYMCSMHAFVRARTRARTCVHAIVCVCACLRGGACICGCVYGWANFVALLGAGSAAKTLQAAARGVRRAARLPALSGTCFRTIRIVNVVTTTSPSCSVP